MLGLLLQQVHRRIPIQVVMMLQLMQVMLVLLWLPFMDDGWWMQQTQQMNIARCDTGCCCAATYTCRWYRSYHHRHVYGEGDNMSDTNRQNNRFLTSSNHYSWPSFSHHGITIIWCIQVRHQSSILNDICQKSVRRLVSSISAIVVLLIIKLNHHQMAKHHPGISLLLIAHTCW